MRVTMVTKSETVEGGSRLMHGTKWLERLNNLFAFKVEWKPQWIHLDVPSNRMKNDTSLALDG